MDTQQTDVVVIGAGASGMAAAIEASRAGAEVLVVERAGHTGGNAAMSTGYVAMTGTVVQQREGVEDSVERFVDDMLAEVERKRAHHGVVFDEALARRYAEESGATYEFLRELGISFTRHIPRPKQHTANRMLAIETVSKIEQLLIKTSVRVRLKTSAVRLRSENSRIIGVTVMNERTGAMQEVHARQGVILAAGSYQASKELRQRWQPAHMSSGPHIGMATCQGDGHLMGDAVGGDLANMMMIPMTAQVGSRLLEDCIAINHFGRRFHDEAGPYDDRKEALQAHTGKSYYICDDVTFRQCEDLIHMMPEHPLRGRTLEALAHEISVPASELVHTVERWNAFLATADPADPEFNRVVLPSERRQIMEPPFAALPATIGATFAFGGLRTNLDMQVVNVFDEVIPGLYAVGDCAAGVLAACDLGGIHLGSGFTLGRVAGRSIAGKGAS